MKNVLAASPLLALLGASLLGAIGCSAIVGAECRDGLVRVGTTCVAPGTDAGSDGASASDAGDAGAPLDAADVDVGALDGGDGGASDGGALDASDAGALDAGALDGGDAGASDAGALDAGPPPCGLGQILCSGACIDGLSDPSNCGACANACAASELCAGGTCSITCDPPTTLCAGRCLDLRRDPDNCGGCGVVCASGICVDGDCSDPLAGHVVVVGHDYVTSRRGMNRIAGNAVFLARGSPVSVVVWEGGSSAPSRLGTDAAIQQVALATGRAWTRTAPADPMQVPLDLAKADAFVIYAQSSGDDASLRSLGRLWSRALAEFVARGGVIVMFETASSAISGTWEILDAAGLFACAGRTETTGSLISIVAPSDAVALLAPLAYSGERTSVRFDTSATTVVASDGVGPVVIHLTVVP